MQAYRRFYIVFLLILICVFRSAEAQNVSIISQERFVKISPTYQSWRSDLLPDPSAFTSPIVFYMPINAQMAVNMYTNQTRFQADQMSGLSGLGDMQISLHYHLPESNLLFQMSANLPTGKRTLSLDEFQSSMVLGQNYLGFNMPSLGQGLNFTPGVSWAKRMGDNMILGLGAALQYSGAFQPLVDLDSKYSPGIALLITGGIDYQFDAVTALSCDMVFSTFGKDKFDSLEVYQSGNKLVASVQFQKYMGFNHLRVFARYRSRAKSLSVRGGELVKESEKSYPDYFLLFGQYTYRVNPQTNIGALIENRYFFNMPGLKTLDVVVLGAAPAHRLNSRITLTGHIKFMFGAFDAGDGVRGLDLSLGLKYTF